MKSPAAILYDSSGNPLYTIDDGGNKRLAVSAKIDNAGNGNVIKIEDGDGLGFKAAVTNSKRLLVSSFDEAPPGTTPVLVSQVSTISGIEDNVYIIPSGETLYIVRFAGGSNGGTSGKSSKISLFYDPNGTGVGMTVIRLAYTSTSNFDFAVVFNVTGDGTKAIRMRRERLDGGALEVAGFWDGYY